MNELAYYLDKYFEKGKRVYIAGPYTKGDVAVNVKRVMDTADEVIRMGHIPFIPHLTHFWHLVSPKAYEFWLEYDMSFLEHWAEIVLRIEGESNGADGEVKRAIELGIPVYYNLKELHKARREE